MGHNETTPISSAAPSEGCADPSHGFKCRQGVTLVCGSSPSPGTPGEGWGGGALPRRQLQEPPPLPARGQSLDPLASPGVPGEGGGRGPRTTDLSYTLPAPLSTRS